MSGYVMLGKVTSGWQYVRLVQVMTCYVMSFHFISG